jgi:unsaturated rhamnogalacturonyl hydrolase
VRYRAHSSDLVRLPPLSQEVKSNLKSPIEVAVNLDKYYGHELNRSVVYTQGVSLSGRLRLHDLRPDLTDDPSAEIESIVSEYASDFEGIFTDTDGTANFAGLCWADELADSTGNDKYSDLLKYAADLFGPTVEEGPLDPDIRVEDFFFAATMLGRAFRSTGDSSYANLLAEFLLSADTLQENGLWWHCKASPFFWGRGNAFAFIGFAEALTYLPADHPARPELLATHLRHLNGLVKHQDESGMWRQIIDMPETFLEFSATAMIGYSIARGLREGWLDDEWRSVVDKAWDGIANRISDEGELEHVCVGTGPLATLNDYVIRSYSDGLDDRGGAMAIWFAVEMARLESESN